MKDVTVDSFSFHEMQSSVPKSYLVKVIMMKSSGYRGHHACTKKGLLPDMEHTFRVYVIHKKKMDEWVVL